MSVRYIFREYVFQKYEFVYMSDFSHLNPLFRDVFVEKV